MPEQMTENYSVKKIIFRGLATATFFTVLWASWAYYINMVHGEAAAIRAAITQGSFTIVNGFIYTTLMEYLFSLGRTPLARFGLAFILPNILVTVVLSSMHYLRGTNSLVETVAPLLMLIYSLSLLYVLVLGPRKLNELDEAGVT